MTSLPLSTGVTTGANLPPRRTTAVAPPLIGSSSPPLLNSSLSVAHARGGGGAAGRPNTVPTTVHCVCHQHNGASGGGGGGGVLSQEGSETATATSSSQIAGAVRLSAAGSAAAPSVPPNPPLLIVSLESEVSHRVLRNARRTFCEEQQQQQQQHLLQLSQQHHGAESGGEMRIVPSGSFSGRPLPTTPAPPDSPSPLSSSPRFLPPFPTGEQVTNAAEDATSSPLIAHTEIAVAWARPPSTIPAPQSTLTMRTTQARANGAKPAVPHKDRPARLAKYREFAETSYTSPSVSERMAGDDFDWTAYGESRPSTPVVSGLPRAYQGDFRGRFMYIVLLLLMSVLVMVSYPANDLKELEEAYGSGGQLRPPVSRHILLGKATGYRFVRGGVGSRDSSVSAVLDAVAVYTASGPVLFLDRAGFGTSGGVFASAHYRSIAVSRPHSPATVSEEEQDTLSGVSGASVKEAKRQRGRRGSRRTRRYRTQR